MAGSLCPVELMKQVEEKMYMKVTSVYGLTEAAPDEVLDELCRLELPENGPKPYLDIFMYPNYYSIIVLNAPIFYLYNL